MTTANNGQWDWLSLSTSDNLRSSAVTDTGIEYDQLWEAARNQASSMIVCQTLNAELQIIGLRPNIPLRSCEIDLLKLPQIRSAEKETLECLTKSLIEMKRVISGTAWPQSGMAGILFKIILQPRYDQPL